MNRISTTCPDCLGDWSCELCWAQLTAALVATQIAVVIVESVEDLSEVMSTDNEGYDSSFELIRDDIIEEDGEYLLDVWVEAQETNSPTFCGQGK